MKAFRWAIAITIITVSSALSAAEANGVSVSHYEALERLSIRSASISNSPATQKLQRAAPVDLSFDAYGRTFDLQLEPNNSLLSVASRNAGSLRTIRTHGRALLFSMEFRAASSGTVQRCLQLKRQTTTS